MKKFELRKSVYDHIHMSFIDTSVRLVFDLTASFIDNETSRLIYHSIEHRDFDDVSIVDIISNYLQDSIESVFYEEL